MAASDFAPEPIAGKLSSDAETLTLRCRRLPKVIRSVRDWSPVVYLVGFKLLSGAPEAELIRQAEAACRENRADLTVANDLRTVRAGRHVIHLVRPGHPTETLGPDRSPSLAEPAWVEPGVSAGWAWTDNRRWTASIDGNPPAFGTDGPRSFTATQSTDRGEHPSLPGFDPVRLRIRHATCYRAEAAGDRTRRGRLVARTRLAACPPDTRRPNLPR